MGSESDGNVTRTADASNDADEVSADPSADADRADPLVVWSFATAHVALLVAVGISIAYVYGGIGDALAGSGTGPGVALFLFLWALTWWTHRRAFEGLSLDGVETGDDVVSLLTNGALWGGATGLLFFWGLFLFLVGVVVFYGPPSTGDFLFLGIVLAIGSLLAAIVGLAIGLSFAVLDLLVLRLTDVAVPPMDATG